MVLSSAEFNCICFSSCTGCPYSAKECFSLNRKIQKLNTERKYSSIWYTSGKDKARKRLYLREILEKILTSTLIYSDEHL